MRDDRRTYVITGSASGIGGATAAAARALGHAVIGVDLHDAEVCVDLATLDGRAALVEGVLATADESIDAVIACAGVTGASAVEINYFGMVATLEGLRPLLAESAAPRAVGVASLAAIHDPDPELVELCLSGDEVAASKRSSQYASSKAAFCRWVRRTAPTPDWAAAGIALNAVAPGTIRTPMTASFLATAQGTAIVDTLVPMPLNGHADPEQLAHLLLFLTSPENTHVTGQVIFADGGADAILRGDTIW